MRTIADTEASYAFESTMELYKSHFLMLLLPCFMLLSRT